MDRSTANRAVVFDLDGTLIDPFEGIAEAYRYMAADLNLSALSDAQIRRCVGPPIQVALRDVLNLNQQLVADGIGAFRRYYDCAGYSKFRAIPGIEAVLEQVVLGGTVLCVATNKPGQVAERILYETGWRPYFHQIVGQDPSRPRRTKSELIRELVRHLPPRISPIAVVGDRGEDIFAARENGLPGIGVRWGYGSDDELISAGAAGLVDTPAELPAHFVRLA